jgi:hypothetical protein
MPVLSIQGKAQRQGRGQGKADGERKCESMGAQEMLEGI